MQGMLNSKRLATMPNDMLQLRLKNFIQFRKRISREHSLLNHQIEKYQNELLRRSNGCLAKDAIPGE